jgi:hypothetical protein
MARAQRVVRNPFRTSADLGPETWDLKPEIRIPTCTHLVPAENLKP